MDDRSDFKNSACIDDPQNPFRQVLRWHLRWARHLLTIDDSNAQAMERHEMEHNPLELP